MAGGGRGGGVNARAPRVPHEPVVGAVGVQCRTCGLQLSTFAAGGRGRQSHEQ